MKIISYKPWHFWDPGTSNTNQDDDHGKYPARVCWAQNPEEKPLIYAVANVDLREDSAALDAGGSRVRVVQVDEKLELLEGRDEVGRVEQWRKRVPGC